MKMQTFRKPHQWLNFWLEKYVEILSGLKYGGEQRKRFWATLKIFLETLPGNPRNLPLDSIRSFVEEDVDERLTPIHLFYLLVAPSKPHIEMLKKIGSTTAYPSASSPEESMRRFRVVLSDQKFSQRTVKNYCAVISAYLKWLRTAPENASVDKINEYCRYLGRERRLAPRTIALHTSALKLFYQQVLTRSSSPIHT